MVRGLVMPLGDEQFTSALITFGMPHLKVVKPGLAAPSKMDQPPFTIAE